MKMNLEELKILAGVYPELPPGPTESIQVPTGPPDPTPIAPNAIQAPQTPQE